MIVLHGWWSVEDEARGELVLWAEDSEGPAEPPLRKGRRPHKQSHPFALPAMALAAVVDRDGRHGTAVLRLPTEGRGPGPSWSATATEDALWEVPTLALDAPAALDLLLERREALDEEVLAVGRHAG